MLCQIILTGRLTRDPELQRTQSDIAYATFSVAVDRDRVSANGERATDFFDIIAWRVKGEFVAKHFGKGDCITVAGRMQQNRWTDADGVKRTKYVVVAENVYFTGDKRNRNGDAALENTRTEYETAQAEGDEYLDEGDLPF